MQGSNRFCFYPALFTLASCNRNAVFIVLAVKIATEMACQHAYELSYKSLAVEFHQESAWPGVLRERWEFRVLTYTSDSFICIFSRFVKIYHWWSIHSVLAPMSEIYQWPQGWNRPPTKCSLRGVVEFSFPFFFLLRLFILYWSIAS